MLHYEAVSTGSPGTEVHWPCSGRRLSHGVRYKYKDARITRPFTSFCFLGHEEKRLSSSKHKCVWDFCLFDDHNNVWVLVATITVRTVNQLTKQVTPNSKGFFIHRLNRKHQDKGTLTYQGQGVTFHEDNMLCYETIVDNMKTKGNWNLS